MDKKIKLLIADDIAETRELIRQLIDINSEDIEIVAEAQNGIEAVTMSRQYKPDLILMDINMPELNGLEAAGRIMEDNPNSIVIIMSVQRETEYLKQAMFSGAKEYIIKPFDSDSLMETLYKTYEKYHVVATPQSEQTGQVNNARLFSCFSTKGGVGKSFIGVNTALALSMLHKKKTLLIDLDLQFGDVALMIDRANSKTLYDCITDGNHNTYEGIESYLTVLNPQFDVLLSPKSPEEAEAIQLDAIETIIKTMLKHYDFILIDLPISFDEIVLYILDQSDKIFYLTSMDILSLKNTKTGMGVMKSLNYDDDKIKLVINRRNESYGIKMSDVEKLFGRKPFTSVLEDEKSTCLSINMGIPFFMNPKNKGNKLYKELVDLSNKIIKE